MRRQLHACASASFHTLNMNQGFNVVDSIRTEQVQCRMRGREGMNNQGEIWDPEDRWSLSGMHANYAGIAQVCVYVRKEERPKKEPYKLNEREQTSAELLKHG